MATKISVYREAARLLGDVRLAALTDDTPQRYAFDDAWASSVEFVLRQAYWNFALRTVIPDASAVPPIIGYSEVFDLPCDWLRTHALFVPHDALGGEPGHEYPFDCRFQAEQIHTNVTPIYLRYITSDAADPELWPEHFSNAVAARLAYETAERITGNPARTDQMFQLWGEALTRAAPVDAIPVNPWLIHQLDGTFETSSRTILQAANWRFALKSEILVAESPSQAFPGFLSSFPKPGDWVRTQALFTRDGNLQELPIDAREHGSGWSANVAPTLRYVSSDYLDARLWPEDFRRVVIGHLGVDMGDAGQTMMTEDGQQQRSPILWPQYLARAIEREAIPESPWLRFQFNGALYQGVRWLLDQAFWRFAVKTVELSADRDLELLSNGDFDTGVSWTQGTGWFIHSGKAHKEAGTGSDLSQAASPVKGVAYELTFTVSNYVAGTVTPLFTGGTDVTGTARSANGTYTETLTAETGNNLAVLRANAAGDFSIDDVSLKQVTAGLAPSPGYEYAFTKPADFGRTFHLYRRCGTRWDDIDFRDEDSRLHANYDTITLRYVSTGGEDPTTWSDGFERSLLAYLEFEEAKRAPGQAGAQVMAREAVWKEAFKNARIKDDMTERPRWKEPSRLVQARMGGSGRFGMNREMGW